MMAEETIDRVSERLTKLEVTVAREFLALNGKVDSLDGRVSSLDRKIDAKTDALQSDIRTVLDAVTALTVEVRRRAAP